MKDPNPNCKYCEGKGTVTVDYHDPSDQYGHGEYERPCECTIENDDQDGGVQVRPKEPKDPNDDTGGEEADPEEDEEESEEEEILSPLQAEDIEQPCKT